MQLRELVGIRIIRKVFPGFRMERLQILVPTNNRTKGHYDILVMGVKYLKTEVSMTGLHT